MKAEDLFLRGLKILDTNKLKETSAKVFYAKFRENLETSVELRVCKSELWSVSHMFGAFKTPSLRHVSETAPYMQTGQFNTLKPVIEYYDMPVPPYYN